MAELIEFVGDEPLVPADLTVPARLDADVAAEMEPTLSGLVIPAMRQVAESRSGSAIRKGRYRDTFAQAPKAAFALDMGQAYAIDSITIGGVVVDPSTYALRPIDRDRVIDPPAGGWPGTGQMIVTYLAGVDIEHFPSVKNWLVMACAWVIEQPSLFVAAETVAAVPDGFLGSLLWPICVPARI